MIIVNELQIFYKNKKVINNFSFVVKENDINILIGTNGSGKTSILSFLCNTLSKKHYRFVEYSNPFNKQSYMIDKFNLPPTINALKYLNLFTNNEYSCDILDRFSIENKQVGSLSKGNMQKLQILATLLKDSQLYILDEPFTALDLETKDLIIDLINIKILEGKTVLLTTHEDDMVKKLKGNEIML